MWRHVSNYSPENACVYVCVYMDTHPRIVRCLLTLKTTHIAINFTSLHQLLKSQSIGELTRGASSSLWGLARWIHFHMFRGHLLFFLWDSHAHILRTEWQPSWNRVCRVREFLGQAMLSSEVEMTVGVEALWGSSVHLGGLDCRTRGQLHWGRRQRSWRWRGSTTPLVSSHFTSL